MQSCVVYESMYGNTHEMAEAIADGLEDFGTVTVGSVADIEPTSVDEFDLLVVGGPTHAHGMSRAATRQAAADTAEADEKLDLEPDAAGDGLREWLRGLPPGAGVHCAAFDTRIDKPVVLVGSAAKGIAKQLRHRHFVAIADPESFFVEGSDGPVQAGERERAVEWGQQLAERVGEQVGELRPVD